MMHHDASWFIMIYHEFPRIITIFDEHRAAPRNSRQKSTNIGEICFHEIIQDHYGSVPGAEKHQTQLNSRYHCISQNTLALSSNNTGPGYFNTSGATILTQSEIQDHGDYCLCPNPSG